jgi:hypothetical protein
VVGSFISDSALIIFRFRLAEIDFQMTGMDLATELSET